MSQHNDANFDPNADQLFIEPPVWPKVIGILSIIFGVLGFGCIGCAATSLFVFIPMAEGTIGEPMPDPMTPGVVQYAMLVIGVLLNALLVGAGTMTLMRNQSARMLHLGWSMATVVVTLVSTFMQFSQQQAVAQWIADNPESKWAQQPGQGGATQYIGLVIGLLMGLAWPIFCIIWFGFIKTKRSQMTGQAEDDHDPMRPETM